MSKLSRYKTGVSGYKEFGNLGRRGRVFSRESSAYPRWALNEKKCQRRIGTDYVKLHFYVLGFHFLFYFIPFMIWKIKFKFSKQRLGFYCCNKLSRFIEQAGLLRTSTSSTSWARTPGSPTSCGGLRDHVSHCGTRSPGLPHDLIDKKPWKYDFLSRQINKNFTSTDHDEPEIFRNGGE